MSEIRREIEVSTSRSKSVGRVQLLIEPEVGVESNGGFDCNVKYRLIKGRHSK